jgi:ABC-2 type transport system permease protein
VNLFGWAHQELRRWRATPMRLALALAPLVATALCLMVYTSRTVRAMPVAVLDQDHSSLSRTLVRDLSAAPQMRIVTVSDLAEIHSGFRQGRFRAAAILPDGMDQAVRLGRTAKVVFWRDATNPMAANQLYSAMSTVVATEGARLVAGRLVSGGLALSQAKEMAMPLRTDPRPFSNPFFDYLANFAPGLFPMFLQMALMLSAGSMLPRGWKASESPLTEIVGRAIPWVGLYTVAAAVFYGLLMPSWGAPIPHPLAVLALVLLLFFASVACGAVFGRYVKSPVQAGQFLLAFNTPAFPLSGYTFPEWAMPPLLSAITRPLPFSLFVDAYRALAGWPTARPVAGWIGLGCWLAASLVLLWIPGSDGGVETEPVTREKEVGGGLRHAFHREFLRLTCTPGLKTLFLAAPVIYLAMYGAMYAGKEERRVPLAVTGGATSQFSREVSIALSAHPQLKVLHMTRSDARAALGRNEVRGVLEVPTDLDIRIRRREATAIPLLFIADRFLPANDLQRSIGEVLSVFGARERMLILEARGMNPAIARERATALLLDDRPIGNPRETYGDFMLPALGILILHQLCFIAAAFAAAASPGAHRLKDFVARVSLLAGWYGAWGAVWIGLVLPAMSVPVNPHVGPLLALFALGMIATSLLGSFAGIWFKDPGSAAQILAFTSYPFFFASGASWPRELFPAYIDWFGKLVPMTPWIVGANRAIRLDAGFAEIRPEILQLGLQLAIWSSALAVAVMVVRNRHNKLCGSAEVVTPSCAPSPPHDQATGDEIRPSIS